MARVTMPQLGETVAEGTVTKWFKSVGELVTKGDPLFEVSTDKVDTEIPSQFDGVLRAILVTEGQTVDVGTVLALIGDDDEPSTHAATSHGAPADGAARPETRVSPVVRRLLDEHHLAEGEVTGTGPGGRVTRDDVLAAVAGAAAAHESAPSSPMVRKLLKDHGLDEAQITGTGPGGRITRGDVEAALQDRRGDDVVPFTKIRALTAEHMVRSKATSAHTLMIREVDYEHVEGARRRHGERFKETEGFSLTYLPFNATAALEALRDFPHLNASVGDGELLVHRDRNLGIAVDLDGQGLVVPVVRRADQLGFRELARAIRALATAARAKSLTVDDTARGTFTITNPGPFGTLVTGAIINQPQVAILSTDAVTRKPVVLTSPRGEESLGIHSVGLLALTFDHRVIDGAYAARFLAAMDEILQTRDWDSAL